MIPQKEVDYLIIGQGLAGSALALELQKRDQKIFVYDEPAKNHSSSVAAGLFNPITGKVMTKTWKADKLFPFLFNFYGQAEKKLGIRFFHPMPLYRPFISVQEQNEWMGKSTEPGMQSYLEKIAIRSEFGHHVHDDFGGLVLSHCGYVDTNLFIRSVRENLHRQESFRQESFHENNLVVNEDFVFYQDVKARKVIFCNGSESAKSMFFNWLPFKPLKGETIHIQVNEQFDCIYNRGVYLVPSGQPESYKVGATYNTRDFSESVTAEGKAELVEKLNDLLKIPYEITNQSWGIRPSTADRRPFLGSHPQEKNVVIFNGLGTKGVSLAPYFASQLADWLISRGEIDKEVNINRCKFKK